MSEQYGIQTTGQELVANYSNIIKGKVILTTGVSPGGLGAHFLHVVSQAEPALLILAGRDVVKCQETGDAINKDYPSVKVKILQLNLSSFSAVRTAAEKLLDWADVPAIDVVVNNAGIMAVPYTLTGDGYESQFASNHLGHFLFTNLIMPKILAAPSPRVISISSAGHRFGGVRFADINFDNGALYDKWVAYGQSKTANILFARRLAQKLAKHGLLAFSVHPGRIGTNLSVHLDRSPGGDVDAMIKVIRSKGLIVGFSPQKPFISLDQGIATHIFAAFDPNLAEHNGKYLLECGIADPYQEDIMCWATSNVEADRLWTMSETIVDQKFEY